MGARKRKHYKSIIHLTNMSLGLLVSSGIKMILSWIIGLVLILIGGAIVMGGAYSALATHSKGVMYIGFIFGFPIAAFGALIIYWGSHKYDVELGPGHKSKARRFHY